jgi:hypothetical protein
MTGSTVRTTPSRAVFILLLAVLAVAAIAVLASVASPARQPPQQPGAGGPDVEALDLLEEARSAVTFEVRYPEELPEGLTLTNVTWQGADPLEDPDSRFSGLDYWLNVDGGGRLHVWQTNLPDLGDADPTRSEGGVAETIGDRVWVLRVTELGSQVREELSRRFDDGVLVSIDLDSATLVREFAAKLR